MSNSIFRKSSIDRMNSPEQLNEYIRVARPGVWLVLAAIILLLIGVIVWSIFGSVTSVVDVAVFADGGDGLVCYIPADSAEDIRAGMTVTIADDTSVTVVSVSEAAYDIAEGEQYMLQYSGISAADGYCIVKLSGDGIESGIYQGEILVEQIRPITFVTQ